MKINEAVGIIRDAFFYGVAFFNKKTLDRDPASFNIDESIRLYHYNNFRTTSRVPNPPECLFPLFYTDGRKCCVLTAYFDKYFDYFNDTIESFYSMLLNKSQLKKFVMAFYFDNHFNEKELQKLCLSEGETVLKAATILSEIVDIKYYTEMFYHFSRLVDATIEFFHQLIPLIQAYHSKRKTETADTLQNFISVDNQRFVRKSLIKNDKGDSIKLENQVYTVCYLNQYIVAYYCPNIKYIFVLGIDWHMLISQVLDYHHVTMQSIMTSLGHPTKVEIVNELRKGDMTISQLARALSLARTSISRYIEDLLDELVIIKARKSGAEIYYRLNATYLQHAKNTFIQFLDQAILDADK